MFAAENYIVIYCYGVAALTCLTCLVYLRSTTDFGFAESFNKTMVPTVTLLMTLFIGLRPLSWMFVDMGTYVSMYYRAKAGEKVTGDWGFDTLLTFFSENFAVVYFFLFCAALYIIPLAIACFRRHGSWGWPAFVALLGGFSFFNYGVNGIRHGIATSLVIAALSIRENKVGVAVMLMIASTTHKSVVITAIAFVIASLINRPGLWASIWVLAAASTAAIGETINTIIFNFLPFIEDSRTETYLLTKGQDKGGYRWDFILYSSIPIIISYAFAPTRVKADKEYKVLLSTYILTNTFWVLVIYAAYSNRFAYLSWSILPWLVTYPFIGLPPTSQGQPALPPQTALLALALAAHFSFTFLMLLFYV